MSRKREVGSADCFSTFVAGLLVGGVVMTLAVQGYYWIEGLLK